jgi:hypothetical protein
VEPGLPANEHRPQIYPPPLMPSPRDDASLSCAQMTLLVVT